jgi:RloB-like protein
VKRKRPLERSSKPFRDSSLIVIASEDEFAVKQYFSLLRAKRAQFKVLETRDGASSPEHVVQRLLEYKEEFQVGEKDELWYVSDIDHWNKPNHIGNLSAVLTLCRQQGFGVALSNPCFEYWLLLHYENVAASPVLTCGEIAGRIRAVVGAYNKTRVYSLPIGLAQIREAVNRAETIYADSQTLGTTMQTGVHRIIQEMIAKQMLEVIE